MTRTMKIIIIIFSIIIAIVVALILIFRHPAFGRSMSKERMARIENSDNYHDGMFHNEIPTPQFTGKKSAFGTLWDFVFNRPDSITPVSPVPAVKTDLHALSIDYDWLVWFGHSSYLFCLNGKRYLVDPLLNMEFPVTVMMRPFKGTDIYSPDDMPDIDVLIITHEHWDHLDYATLRDLRPKVKHVVCSLGVAEYLEYWGYDKGIITEMDWYEHFQMPELQSSSDSTRVSSSPVITCLPTRHFSNRLFERNQTLWASFLVQDNNRQVYIGGDGGYDSRFKMIYERYGSVDLALMENGQYNDDWKYIHLIPADLERAILDLRAKQVFTVHHDKFALARHAWSEPDNVARSIAERDSITLLDQPIGTVVTF